MSKIIAFNKYQKKEPAAKPKLTVVKEGPRNDLPSRITTITTGGQYVAFGKITPQGQYVSALGIVPNR